MLIKQYYMTRPDGVELEITFSDQGRVVVRDGVSYDEAIDVKNRHLEYTEGRVLVYDPVSAVEYWTKKINEEEAVIDDVPEWMRERVEDALRR